MERHVLGRSSEGREHIYIYIHTWAWISQPFTWLVDTKSYRHLYLVIFCYMVIWYMALSGVHCSELLAGSIPLTWCFFGAQLNFAFDLVHHILLNWQPKYKKKTDSNRPNRWKLSPNKAHKLNKNPELDPTRTTQKQICSATLCFFHLPSIQHGMTGHEKPSSTAGGGILDNFKSVFPSFSCKKMHFQKVFSWWKNSVLEICIAWKDGVHWRLMPARALGSKLSDVLSANIISIALLTRRHLHQLGYSQNMGNSVCFHKRSSSVTRWKGFF